MLEQTGAGNFEVVIKVFGDVVANRDNGGIVPGKIIQSKI